MVSKNKEAFTLVELSIVLVIIGLIVGGVVGGQSLVASSRINKTITEFSQYKTAYNAFQLQYDAIPGDFAEGFDYWDDGTNNICGTDEVSGHRSCNGNGDNLMQINDGVRAFKHLQLSGIMPNVEIAGFLGRFYLRPCAGERCIHSENRNNVPNSAILDDSNVGWVFASHDYIGSDTNWYGKTGNWLQLGAEVSWWLLDGGAITPRQASIMDKKIDDGSPVRGNIAAMTGGDGDAGDINAAMSPACLSGNIVYWRRDRDHSAMTYNISEDNRSCVLHFYLGY
jgi:prepilin-type N-terminal cleavage/methylation domain-containing protein